MELNRIIDYTLLKAEATRKEVLEVIEEAKKQRFYAICISPSWVFLAAKELKRDPTVVCTVIGYPFGTNTSEAKAFETKNAIENGADEIDMVMNIGALKSGMEEKVQADMQAVVDVAKDQALVKVIIEMNLLTKEELLKACELARAAGADFIKASTGLLKVNTTVAEVKLLKEIVAPEMGVKVSCGIYDEDEALAMLEAGASRLEISASVSMMTKNDKMKKLGGGRWQRQKKNG